MKIIKQFKKIAKIFALAASVAAMLFASVSFAFKKMHKEKYERAKSNAQRAKDKKYDEIKKSSGNSLILNSHNASELQSIAKRIKDENAEQIQNRISEAGL